jgi:hypothetical protein
LDFFLFPGVVAWRGRRTGSARRERKKKKMFQRSSALKHLFGPQQGSAMKARARSKLGSACYLQPRSNLFIIHSSLEIFSFPFGPPSSVYGSTVPRRAAPLGSACE